MTAQKDIELVKFKSTPVFLISGGAGALAYFVIKRLLEYFKDIKIVAVDSLETSSDARIKTFNGDSRFLFVKHDLNLGIPLDAQQATCVLHLAAISSHIAGGEEISLNSLLTSAFATRNLLELAVKNNARFLLASSISVYQGIISSLNLKNYFGPNQQTEKKFSHIEARRFAEALVWEYTKKYKMDSRIVRLGEMFGPEVDLRNNLGQIMDQVVKLGIINIEGDGLEKDYYSFAEDAAEAVVRAVVVKDTKDKIFPICYEKSASLIEVSYIIKAVSSQDIRISFKKTDNLIDVPEIKSISRENLALLGWKPKVSLEEGIKKTLIAMGYTNIRIPSLVSLAQGFGDKVKNENSSSVFGDLSVDPPDLEKIIGKVENRVSKIYKKLFLSLLLIAGIFCLVNGFYVFRTYASDELLAKSRASFYQGNMTESSKWLTWANRILPSCSMGGDSFLAKNLNPTNYLNRCRFLNYSAEFATSNRQIFKIFSDIFKDKQFSDKTYNDLSVEIKKAKEYAYMSISVNPSGFNTESLGVLDDLEIALPGLRDFLGFDGERNYLILIQNTSKLKVSGGEVTAVTAVRLDKGEITSLEVSPADFSKGQSAFKDFNGMAYTYAKNFSQISSQKIAGVVGINTDFLKFLLEPNGSVYLPDPGITVDESNFDSIFSDHPYQLCAKIFEKVLQKNDQKAISFESVLSFRNYLARKSVLISYLDLKYKDIFDRLGWSGSFLPYRGDYIYATDSNTGTTAVSNLVSKRMEYGVGKESDGKYLASLVLSYKHQGVSNSFPGGPYEGEYRIYIPYDAKAPRVYVQAGSVDIDITKDVVISSYNSYLEISGILALNAGKETTIKIVYEPSSRIVNLIESGKYSLLVQKQPGAPASSIFVSSPLKFTGVVDRDIFVTE